MNSGFLAILEHGDVRLADKGFDTVVDIAIQGASWKFFPSPEAAFIDEWSTHNEFQKSGFILKGLLGC